MERMNAWAQPSNVAQAVHVTDLQLATASASSGRPEEHATHAQGFSTTEQPSEVGGHVRKAGVMALERQRECTGRTIAVFGHYDVGLAFTGRLTLIHRLAMEQDHHVGILFY
jgi:phosphoribosylformimino-5-aminoimidazole carboxamide ribonucleotide (ProFAR) isomerase